MLQLQTPVALPEYPFRLHPDSRVMLIGSCFAQHMGVRLQNEWQSQRVLINPMGVVYNPLSIATQLSYLINEKNFDEDLFFVTPDQQIRSWLHAGAWEAPNLDAAKAQAEQQRTQAAAFLQQTDLLVLTWGTARCYRLRSNGSIVSNCHKQPATTFEEYDPPLDLIIDHWQQLLAQLHQYNPRLNIVFTVSPYRYLKYGHHGSQLSKAKLLLAIDELCRSSQSTHYFPAYEIVLDELRDYRFFQPDMLHPTAQTVDYVTQQFAHCCYAPELHEFARERTALLRDMSHRPLQPDSQAHRRFQQQLELRLQVFRQKWGMLPD